MTTEKEWRLGHPGCRPRHDSVESSAAVMKFLLRLNLALTALLVNLSVQPLSRYVRTNRSEATIEVRVGERSPFRVPRTRYGTFLEDISYSVLGGVSAQILDYPSLEDYSASLDTLKERFPNDAFRQASALGLPLPWLPLRKSGMRYERRWGHRANSNRSLDLMGIPGQEVGIRQTVYLPIEREHVYEGVLFARPSEAPIDLTVNLGCTTRRTWCLLRQR